MSKVVSSSSTYRFCGGCDDVVLHSYDVGPLRGLDSYFSTVTVAARYDYRCCECGLECSEVEVVHLDESEV